MSNLPCMGFPQYWVWTLLDSGNDIIPINERNEAGWWGNWAEVRWFRSGYFTSTSKEFEEPLFNRCGIASPTVRISSVIGSSERGFGQAGYVPSFFVPDRKEYYHLSDEIIKRGYRLADRMDVLALRGAQGLTMPDSDAEIEISSITRRGIHEWASVYIASFGEDLRRRPAIGRSLERALRRRGVTLLMARWNGLPAGITALYERDGASGLYCVGVLPEYRKRGIGMALVNQAVGLAADNDLIVLQAFRSDSAADFYERMGFRRAYSKAIFVKGGATEGEEGVQGAWQVPGQGAQATMGGTPAGAVMGLLPTGITIVRNVKSGRHPFFDIFQGFERLPVLKGLFRDPRRALERLQVIVDPRPGYMHVDDENGSVYVSARYLKDGDPRYLFLDIVHELVHVRQFQEGRELFDDRFSYYKRPTEVEAYETAVSEARSLGMTRGEIIEYLKVEWATDEEFADFIAALGDRLGPD